MSKNCAAVSDTGIVLNIMVYQDDEPESANLIAYTDEHPAYVGGDYVDGYFYPPQPFASWTRSEGNWIPPVPRPDTEGNWQWNEELQEWED